MKTLSLLMALMFIVMVSVTAQQERYNKNNNIASQQQEFNYEPVQADVSVSKFNESSGRYANCFYYGDPCGMYLEKEWQEGDASLLDGSTLEGEFRYNICAQKMEAAVGGDTFAFARPGEVEKLRIGQQKFIYCNFMRSDGELASSWFELLCEGNCSLLVRRFIKYRVADGDDDPANDMLYRLDEYYTCTDKGSLNRLNISRNDVLEVLKNHEDEIAAYIRHERLNVKERNDLIEVFAYYNKLD